MNHFPFATTYTLTGRHQETRENVSIKEEGNNSRTCSQQLKPADPNIQGLVGKENTFAIIVKR